MQAQAQQAVDAGATLTAEPAVIAELLVRIAHSLVLTPDTDLPIGDDEQLEALARETLAPMVIARPPSTERRHV